MFRSKKACRPPRRAPRGTAFRSTDLADRVRVELEPPLVAEGFRRLGKRGWITPSGENSLMVKLQAQRSGWDRYAGSLFVVEFEVSATPKLDTGWHRQRLWGLLREDEREAFHRFNKDVAATLPQPDSSYVAALPPSAAEWYLRAFNPAPETPSPATDVWFRYYDENDATAWGQLLAGAIGPALEAFWDQPPIFYKRLPDST